MGAVAGSDDVMEVFDHRSGHQVHHGGTFNANPVTMTAGLTAMKMMTPEAFDRIGGLGDYVRGKLSDLIVRKEVPAQITGSGSLFWFHLTDQDMNDFRDFSASGTGAGDVQQVQPRDAGARHCICGSGAELHLDGDGSRGDGCLR